jgi:hypothetical protein
LGGSLAAIGTASAAGGIKAAADYGTLIARMRAGGLSGDFVSGVEGASASLTRRFPNLGKEDVAGLAWPVRRISSSDEDALGRMNEVARVASAWKASGGTLDKFGEIFKAIDILDLGLDRATFGSYLEEDAKAFADMSKQSGAALSTRRVAENSVMLSIR